MAATTEVLIGDSGAQHVLIRPWARSNPGLFDERDGNWIDCEVELSAGGFHGRFRTDVSSEEFQIFMEQVEGVSTAVDGTASLTTMEGQIALSLTGDETGHVRVAGEVVDVAGNRLQFGFAVNQDALPEIARSLGHLLAAFPTSDSPDE